nr:rhodanese-like domain-containing protein [Desulfohalovibrio reitneri]
MKTAPAAILLLFILASAAPAEERPIWWDDAQRQAERHGYHLIDTPALRKLLAGDPDALLLDVRPDYEYRAGHIPGAVNMSFDLAEADRLPKEKKEDFRDLLGCDLKRPVVVYCRGFR